MRSSVNPLAGRDRLGVLDGGLATELEANGHDLSCELWSARLLIDQPEAIAAVHAAYLEAGADVVIAASYQASLEGFAEAGHNGADGERFLRRSVELAIETRNRARPSALVAASIGPYGAVLADGSEYRGDYGVSVDHLVEFHRQRWNVLASAGADLFACETLPSGEEVRALARLLEGVTDSDQDTPWAWFSFSCRDAESLRDGTPLRDCVDRLRGVPRVAGLGVNCVDPPLVVPLIEHLRDQTDLPLLAYPNSGELWNAATRSWEGSRDPVQFAERARAWRSAGADWIGGCCRTGPRHIRLVREFADGESG